VTPPVAEARPELLGPTRAMVGPPILAGGAGAVLAAWYSYLTLAPLIPPGAGPRFALIVTVVLAVAVTVINLRSRRRLSTLLRLGRGQLPLDTAALQAAVREVLTVPDAMFRLGVAAWTLGALAVGLLLMLFVRGVPWTVPGRLLAMAALFGLPSSLLSYCLIALRSRELVRALCRAGLKPDEVIAAFPPTRAQIRARLVAFTAICIICPAALTADLSSTFAREGYARVAAAERPADRKAMAAEVRSEALAKVAVMGALVFGLAVLTAFLGGTALTGPMREIASEATAIAEGRLEAPRAIPAEDEVWAVAAAFTAMQTHLTTVLSQLKRAGVQIGATTEQIVATSGRYENGATEQATALNETSATTEELARSARQIAENAASVAQIAEKTLAAAQDGQSSAEAFSQSMERMRHDNQAIAEAVDKLNKRVQQIGQIVELINGVADKSDLLALNAELEGTKAGEVGRGFGLVAAEMRRLAENVLESTKEIEGLIEEIREATSAAVAATSAGVHATSAGGVLAQQVSESLKEIVALAGQTSDAVRAISLATQQQQSGTDQLAEAMADILRVTQQSLAATKQVSAANVDLTALAQDLRSVVSRFVIQEKAGGRG
jgi:methyl-accepting chemotaxis protein